MNFKCFSDFAYFSWAALLPEDELDGNVEVLIVDGLLEVFGKHSDSERSSAGMPGKIFLAGRNQLFLRRIGIVVEAEVNAVGDLWLLRIGG